MTRPAVTVTLCHDCCCGTLRKHPDVDHRAQRERLLACASERVRVRTAACLDECDRSNVVHVREHLPEGRRDTWLGGVLADDATNQLVDWLGSGGALPDRLAGHVFGHVPPRAGGGRPG